MKQTISFKTFITFLTLFAAFTAFSSLYQINTSHADVSSLDLTCKDSQRGVRCGYFQTVENVGLTAAEINRFVAQLEEFCSVTSRGSRCIKKSEEFPLLKINELKSGLPDKTSCSDTVRGTRCSNGLNL